MTKRPDPGRPKRRGASRGAPAAAAVAAALALVLAIQLWTSHGKFERPFLDTRLHYDYDNAFVSFMARSGNRNGDLRSQFGATLNRYAAWGVRRGEPAYYTDHPFLVKALFQQFSRAAGTAPRASRAFYAAVSFAIAAGLFVVLLQATGEIAPALSGAAVLAALPLFATYQTCVKYEADGMAAAVWTFAALAGFVRRGGRARLALYGVAVAACWLTHWTAALEAGALAVGLLVLWRRRRDARLGKALAVTAAAGAAGAAALAAWEAWMQRGLGAARDTLARAFATRAAPVAMGAWWERQREYALQNFGAPMLVVALLLAVLLGVRWVRAGRAGAATDAALLPLFFFTTLAAAVAWLAAFRQGSFVHVYWQYLFCLPLSALVSGFVASLPAGSGGRAAALAAVTLLVASLLGAAQAAHAGILRDQMGTPEDVAFLASLRDDRFERFVYVPLTDVPLNQWFQGPLFEYYTDRPVAVAAGPEDLHAGDKMLVLRYREREDVAARVAAWSGKTLSNEKCATRLCAYDVGP
ncbi:MAG TPA: hypothetical protein VMH79_12045 [Thermoanaerobaculia bacterium]|nr:hypothetical protein [Thermoanaerobaculia bacterium]